MSVSGLSGSTNRITGLASNMDTDAMVKAAMTADMAKYNKILQNRQLDEWRVESYREITSSLQSFYTEYFDSLSTKNIKSVNSFASFSATYGAANSTEYVSVTPGASAKAGIYNITAIKAATAASKSGGDVSKTVIGNVTPDAANIKSSNFNNRFVFIFNGKSSDITLDDATVDSTVTTLAAELKTKLEAAFGTGKIDVVNDGGKLKFSTVRSTDSFSIGTAYNGGADTLFGKTPTETSPITLNDGNNKFELSIDGVVKTITVNNGSYTDADGLATAIQNGVTAAFGSNSGVSFTAKDGKISVSSEKSISITKTKDWTTNATLGIDSSNMSNKMNLTSTISEIKDGIKTTVTDITGTMTGDPQYDIAFEINGVTFTANSQKESIKDIMNKVNSNADINATLKYDITTNSFTIQAKNTGETEKLIIKDKTGNLLGALGIVNGTYKGMDASVTVKNESGAEMTIVRPTNSFAYDGLTFDIKKDFPTTDTNGLPLPATDPIKVTVSSDTSKTYDFIKTFVEKYNELIEKINKKVSEKRYKDYQPLTDEEKKSLSDDQIKQWEDKAKSGLLKNDSIITTTLSKLRTALYSSVDGMGINLSSIGITTTPYYLDKGKLEINETKLKEALATRPEEISKLFTATSDTTYYDVLNDPTLSTKRYKESGLAQRFSDIIQDAIRTNTDKYGNKGSLLVKAGVVGDRSEANSLLSKEILQYDDDAYEMNKKLIAKENALYKKYAAMESALNKLNSQQASLANMLAR